MSLQVLAYNLKRAMNIFGVRNLSGAIAGWRRPLDRSLFYARRCGDTECRKLNSIGNSLQEIFKAAFSHSGGRSRSFHPADDTSASRSFATAENSWATGAAGQDPSSAPLPSSRLRGRDFCAQDRFRRQQLREAAGAIIRAP